MPPALVPPQKEVPIVRKVVSAAAAVVLIAGTGVALSEGVAEAAITTPTAGQVLKGTVTLNDTGGVDNSSILGVKHCSGSVSTQIQLINSGGTVVFAQSKSGAGAFSVSVLTENYPNGNYTVRGIDGNGANSGFGGFGCTTQNVTTNVAVTITNEVTVSYTGATSAPQGTNAIVSATLADPNLTTPALSGRSLTFSLSGGATLSATTNASGVATATLPIAGPPRLATLNVTFAATTFYGAKTASVVFDVQKDPTATTISPSGPSVHGQPVSFSAQVAPTAGSGTPTGTIQFTVDGTNFGAPVTLSGGTATTPATSTLPTADHSIGAHYSGDSNFLASDASPTTHHVGRATTTTTLDTSVNPSVHGQSVTFTAHVAVVAPGAGTPTGGVQFDVDGQPFGTAVALSGDTASLTISNLRTGNHDVVARYDGDGDFAISTSAGITQGVGMAGTSVALTSSDATSVTGEPVSFTAEVGAVGPGAGVPTGSVQFFVDGAPLGGPATLVDGVATSPSTAALAGGAHDVQATYLGDEDFSGSSASFTQTVDPARTTTSVSSSVNPSVFGQPVTFTATVAPVAPGAGTPSGTVQFFVDGAAVGVPVTLAGGVADSAPVSDLAPGVHAVTASYSGDPDFLAGASDPIEQTVTKARTKTTLTSSANPSVFGQPVTFTATIAPVAPGAGAPAGTVTFTDGSTTLATVPVGPETGEQASFTTSSLVVAQHAIGATYSGDDRFLTSTDSVNQAVLRAQTSTVLTSSANPAVSGQAVSFTAVVSPVAPGAGTPTGPVTFTVNGAPLGSPVQLVDGIATSSTFASLSPGTYAIAAKYAGDRNFVTSSAVLDQGTGQNVTKAVSSMALSSSPNPAAFGATVTFVADVSAVAPATGRPSGVVQFFEADVLLGAVSLVPGAPGTSRASFASSTLSTGSHAVRAVYVGNFNFTGQTASTSQLVGQVPTVTGLVAAPNPAVYGHAVTLTATVAADPTTAGTPTGTVTFRNGSTALGTATLHDVAGEQRASITVPSFEAGGQQLTATYSGDATFATSTSPSYLLNVDRAPSTLVAATLITGGSQGIEGNGGRVRATLTGVGGAPLAGQTLVFTTTQPTDHSVIHICTVVTDADGFASCDSTTLIPAIINDGGYDVDFAGTPNYAPSTSHGVYSGGN
jgi:uncharacterized protein (DUF2141 family)